MDILLLILLSYLAKILASLSVLTGRGSGTSYPGLLVEKHFLFILKKFNHAFDEVIFISGTNGKTTTRALMCQIYEDDDIKVCTNRGGANILRGIIASLLLDLDLTGKAKSKVAILEVEEASLPILTKYFFPTRLVLTNLFRDQLDAYGEVDKTLDYFHQTLTQIQAYYPKIENNKENSKKVFSELSYSELRQIEGAVSKDMILRSPQKMQKFKPKPKKTTLTGRSILNFNLNNHQTLSKEFFAKVESRQWFNKLFKLESTVSVKPKAKNSFDINKVNQDFYEAGFDDPKPKTATQTVETRPLKNVKVKNFKLFINTDDNKLLSLLKDYQGEVYGFGLDIDPSEKPEFEFSSIVEPILNYNYLATNIITRNLNSSFTVKINSEEEILVETLLPGIYNLYNILAGLIASFDVPTEQSLESIKHFMPVFGRGEKIALKNSEFTLFLVKNPAGFNQVLNLIKSNFRKKPVNIIYLINDNIADGKDVSWLWDIDMESFVNTQELGQSYTGGSRGLDILLRLQHAGVKVNINNYINDMQTLVGYLSSLEQDFLILATYTAMLEIRKVLATKVKIPNMTDKGN